MPNIIKVNKL
jgi:long-chain acyl-CoA synthetase